MPDNKRTASGVLGGITGVVGLSAVAGVLVAATVTPAIALSGAAATSAITMFDNLPSVLEIDDLMLPSNFYATDPETKKPVLLAKFLEQDRTPVTYDQVSPVMYDAILSSEDPRYFQHGGVDLIGTTRAILSNAQGGGETQGGSTISQQYVKNVLIQKCEQNAEAQEAEDENGEIVQISREQALQDCWVAATTAKDDEGYMRKLQEMRYAIALEQKYSKEEILLGYFNIANFPTLASAATDNKDEMRRLVQAVHVYQREVTRIVEGVDTFDAVRVHFQGPKLHALIYRPIDCGSCVLRCAERSPCPPAARSALRPIRSIWTTRRRPCSSRRGSIA